MDLTIHVKVELGETPALINCFSAFCTTVERCAQLLAKSDRDFSLDVEPPKAIKAAEAAPTQTKAPAEAPSEPVEPVKAEAPKKYTLDDFRSACTPLITADASAGAKIKEIVNSFGANALPEIPADKYPELAEKLRSLGADL